MYNCIPIKTKQCKTQYDFMESRKFIPWASQMLNPLYTAEPQQFILSPSFPATVNKTTVHETGFTVSWDMGKEPQTGLLG